MLGWNALPDLIMENKGNAGAGLGLMGNFVHQNAKVRRVVNGQNGVGIIL